MADQLSCTGPLPPGKETFLPTGAWVDPSAGVDALETTRSLAFVGNRTTIPLLSSPWSNQYSEYIELA